MEDSSREVHLYLSNSRNSHAFTGDQCLWKSEINRIFRLMYDHHENLKQRRENMPDHYSDHHSANQRGSSDDPTIAIALCGTYGSGKSSLLHSLVHTVNRRNNQNLLEDKYKRFREKIFALPIIEPEESQEFLYAFLANALNADMEITKQYGSGSRSEILSPVQQRFQEVSEFLQAINPDKSSTEHDPLGISLDLLDRHSSTLKLKGEIAKFIEELAYSLTRTSGDSLVLLPVDDSDMSRDGLINTLETLRRYLRHPRLVPVFTFTGRLAEELLRVHFSRKLVIGNDDQDKEEKLKEASTEIVITESLAQQYLSKLFPVRNRIRLGNAAARLQASVLRGGIDSDHEKESKSSKGNHVYELMERASTLMFGFPDKPTLPTIRSSLRSSTLRRQIQIIDVVKDAEVDSIFKYHLFVKDKKIDQTNDHILKQYENVNWGKIFDGASWSLLNVHRDVLKEFKLNLDDLYSWTMSGLRNVLLDGVLRKDRDFRQRLIKQWRYRTDDRRCQLLSLLAANTFRPSMYGEELRGEDVDRVKAYVDRRLVQQNTERLGFKTRLELASSFSIRKGFLWFLKVWLGFYLPQLLGRNRRQSEEIMSVGWGLRSAPLHGAREFLVNKVIVETGFARLDNVSFSRNVYYLTNYTNYLSLINLGSIFDHHGKKIDDHEEQLLARCEGKLGEKSELNKSFLVNGEFAPVPIKIENKKEKSIKSNNASGLIDAEISAKLHLVQVREETEIEGRQQGSSFRTYFKDNSWFALLGEIWCQHGYHDERPFAVLSCWRGLSLLGSLIEQDIVFKNSGHYKMYLTEVFYDLVSDGSSDFEKTCMTRRREEIASVIYQHVKRSKILSTTGEEPKGGSADLPFGGWRFNDLNAIVEELVEDLMLWLDNFSPSLIRIQPLSPNTMPYDSDASVKSEAKKERDRWKACFLRRVHGDNILSLFWQQLNYPGDIHGSKKTDHERDANALLKKWVQVLAQYWQCGGALRFSGGIPNAKQNLTQTFVLECPFVSPFNSTVPNLAFLNDDFDIKTGSTGAVNFGVGTEEKYGEVMDDKNILKFASQINKKFSYRDLREIECSIRRLLMLHCENIYVEESIFVIGESKDEKTIDKEEVIKRMAIDAAVKIQTFLGVVSLDDFKDNQAERLRRALCLNENGTLAFEITQISGKEDTENIQNLENLRRLINFIRFQSPHIRLMNQFFTAMQVASTESKPSE